MLVSLGAPGTRDGREVGARLSLTLPAALVLSPLRETGLL